MPISSAEPVEPQIAPEERPDSSFFAPLPGAIPNRTHSAADSKLLTATDFCVGLAVEQMLRRAGLTTNEAARALGITPNALRQYTKGRRQNPSFIWFLKVAELCGAKIRLEFPNAT